MYQDINYKEFVSLKLDPINSTKTKEDIKTLNKLYYHFNYDFNLYSYQRFVLRFFGSYSNVKRFFLKWGTGIGKTKGSLVCAYNFLKLGGKTVFIIGKTKDIFIKELLNDPTFGIVTQELKELLEELKSENMEFEYEQQKKRIKKLVIDKFYQFKGFEKLYNEIFIIPPFVSPKNYDDLVGLIGEGVIKINKSLMDKFRGSFIILDEFHSFYNSNSKNNYGIAMKYILDTLKEDVFVLPLSATPINNDPSEIIELCSILDWNFKYTKEDIFDEVNGINILKKTLSPEIAKKSGCKNAEEIIFKTFYGKISYLETRNPLLYPRQIFAGESIKIPKDYFGNNTIPHLKFIRCPFTKEQQNKYDEVCINNSLSSDNKYIIDYYYPKEAEKKKVGAYDVPIIPDIEKYSNKYAKFLDILLKEKTEKTLVYHKRIGSSGVLFISDMLLEKGLVEYGNYPINTSICRLCKKQMKDHNSKDHEFAPIYFVTIWGEVNQDVRDKIYSVWSDKSNSYGEKITLLLGSKVIEESIDMKAIRKFICLSKTDNIGDFIQLLGRSIRSGSHVLLKPEEQEINIYILVSSLLRDELSYEEKGYYEMMLKFDINKGINDILNRCCLDLFINQDIINTKGNPLSDDPIDFSKIKKPQKIDDRYFNILYKNEEQTMIENIIRATFIKSPVWTYKDLLIEVKNTPINIQVNPKYFDEDNIKLVLHNLLSVKFGENKIVKYNRYYIMTKNESYNFLSSGMYKLYNVNLEDHLNINIDFEEMSDNFRKDNRDLSILKMSFNINKYPREFHIRYCENIIKYIFGILDGQNFSEHHNFYMRVLYFYDKFNLVLYASQINTHDYDSYITEQVTDHLDRYKRLLYTSLSNIVSKKPTFTKFNDLLSKKKVHPDVLPVGHYIGVRPFVYSKNKWEPYSFGISKVTKPNDDYIYGFMERGNDITFDFKIMFRNKKEDQQILDNRTKKKGIICKSLKKDQLWGIIHHYNLDIPDKNIVTICDVIKNKLIELELSHSGKKHFYFIFESANI